MPTNIGLFSGAQFKVLCLGGPEISSTPATVSQSLVCPKCAVSILPGQQLCGFCQRQAERQAVGARRRWLVLGTLAALALGGSCIVMLMGVTPRLSRTTPVLFLLPPGAGRGDPVHVVLDVRVSYCGIHLFLFEDGHWHRIGPGCKMPDDSWDGPAFMLRRPEDYQPLRSCLATLRTRIPAQIEARPRVSYLGRAEAARAIYFVNLLRCGEVTCRESDPRVWGLISMGVGDECVPARDELIPIYMMRLGPALRGCYEAARPRLSERL